LKRNATIGRDQVALCFRGKGGKEIRRDVFNRALARALRAIRQLPGRRLLQFIGEDGAPRPLTAGDVNGYLQRVSGADVSAKDFRMTSASALAAQRLAALSPPAPSESGRRRQLAAVMKTVADDLANTPAIARKSYVHGVVEASFREGALPAALQQVRPSAFRSRAEALVGSLANLQKAPLRRGRSRTAAAAASTPGPGPS
jgi:DNA topoisomerase I